MERDNNKIKTEDIEHILGPKCEFHVSPEFKERVMQAVKAERVRRRHRFMPWLSAAVASAAVIAIIFTITLGHRDRPSISDKKKIVAEHQIKTVTSQEPSEQQNPGIEELQNIVARNVNEKISSKANDELEHRNEYYARNANPIAEEEETADKSDELPERSDDGNSAIYNEIPRYAVFAQIPDEELNQSSGPMPIIATNISGPMPMAPIGRRELISVRISHENPEEYVERLRQNIEQVENLIQNFHSMDNDN